MQEVTAVAAQNFELLSPQMLRKVFLRVLSVSRFQVNSLPNVMCFQLDNQRFCLLKPLFFSPSTFLLVSLQHFLDRGRYYPLVFAAPLPFFFFLGFFPVLGLLLRMLLEVVILGFSFCGILFFFCLLLLPFDLHRPGPHSQLYELLFFVGMLLSLLCLGHS